MSTNEDKYFYIEDWITQAEAARIRNVSRQAINKLVKSKRIRSINVGGATLVNRDDVKNFEAKNSGRPKQS